MGNTLIKFTSGQAEHRFRSREVGRHMGENDKGDWVEYKDLNELAHDLELTAIEIEDAHRDTDDYVRAWRLAQVRRDQQRGQQEVADAMGVSQPRVSAIEQGDLSRVSLSTLRAYVEALGGRLRIVVDFDDQRYRLI